MGNLTKNFSVQEFACPCCEKINYNMRLVTALQDWRDLIHCKIVGISGYRCVKYNKKIKGSVRSKHIYGMAFDTSLLGWTLIEMYMSALSVPAFFKGGIGIYPAYNSIHVDVRTNGPTRWARIPEKGISKYVSLDEGFRYLWEKGDKK